MELTRKQIYDMMWTDGVGKTEINLGLKQAEMPLIDYFLSCGLPKVNNRIRAILWIGYDQFLKILVQPFFDIIRSKSTSFLRKID